jgi:drug/metabolite transporter (DMT)-like permease
MPLGILFALTAAFIWATTSLLVKQNAARVDTLSFNAFRVVVGALFFYALLPFVGGVPLVAELPPQTLLVLGVSVILGFCVGDSIYFWSMTKIGASRTMPISGVYPVFTWLIAVPLLGEEVTPPAIAGTFLVVIALYLLGREHPADVAEANEMLIAPPAKSEPRGISQRTRVLAVAAAVFAALTWACSTTLLRLGIQLQEPVTLYENFQQTVLLGAVRLTIAALVLLPLTQWLKGARVWKIYRGRELTKLFGLALYSTGIGSLFFVLGVALAGAARAALLNSASPLMGVVFSWLFLRERMTRRVWAGTALAVVGVWLVLL